MRRKRHIRDRLASMRGETLVEALIAVLVSSMSMLLLAGAIASVRRILSSSTTKLEAYRTANEVVVQQPTGTVSVDAATAGSGTLSISYPSVVDEGGTATTKTISTSVRYFENQALSDTPVVSYRCLQSGESS